jgi:hypothetical protein
LEYLPGVSNARNFPPEIIKELKQFLLAGWFALPAPRRKRFYNLQSLERRYFIHIFNLAA